MSKSRLSVLFLIFLYSIILLFSPFQVYAVSDPTTVSNNKFGIHVATADDQDLQDGANLVNSSGGSWGYITITIQENDRDLGKWQNVFNRLRRLHVIPLIRLATKPEGANWRRPTKEDAASWVEFLNGLNWVIKNRYVILFNEPNHATEWGGEANPEDYGEVAYAFADALKKASPDFFVMLAGLDQAAPSETPRYFEEGNFLSRMDNHLQAEDKNIFSLIDGWSSHSYPNPGFVGSPNGRGKGSVRGYEWELSYLSNFNVEKQLPVFITETGWEQGRWLDEETVAANYQLAFQTVWLPDQRVVAVTPFILNYQNEPFLVFSFRKPQSNDFYSMYQTLQGLPKTQGEPEQIFSFDIVGFLPTELGADSQFKLLLNVKNTGQTIWDTANNDEFALVSKYSFKYFFSVIPETEPGVTRDLDLIIQTPFKIGSYPIKIDLLHKGKSTSIWTWPMQVIPNIDITINYRLFLNFLQNSQHFSVEIYDHREQLVFKKKEITGVKNTIILSKVKNLAVGEKYRIVLLKENNLPRQVFMTIARSKNIITMKSLLPFDWDRNGKWTLHDLLWFAK